MKMHYLKPLFFGIMMAAAQLSHAEVGVGVSLRADGPRLYMPISLSDNYRLEPSLYYENHKNNQGVSDWKELEVAVGVFRISSLNERVSAYYGARAGYFERDDSYYFQDMEGAKLAPTIGVEYFLSKRFSISGEAAIIYERLDSLASNSREVTRTTTDILLRYIF